MTGARTVIDLSAAQMDKEKDISIANAPAFRYGRIGVFGRYCEAIQFPCAYATRQLNEMSKVIAEGARLEFLAATGLWMSWEDIPRFATVRASR